MLRFAYLAAVGLVAVAVGAAAQGPRPALLDQLRPGSWTLHEIGSPAARRTICVTDAASLLQVHHGAAQCARFVVSSDQRTTTVSYTCAGQGYGRTTLTAESPTLVRIQTQGLAQGAPFDMDYEARRAGICVRSAKNLSLIHI